MKHLYECPHCKDYGYLEDKFDIHKEQYGNVLKCKNCGTETFQEDMIKLKEFVGEEYNFPIINYHIHRDDSNILTKADSIVKPKDYLMRAVELGHLGISSCCHGYQGRYHEVYEHSFYTKCEDCGKISVGHNKDCKCGSPNVKNERLKFLYVVEAYWVKDVIEDPKDRANAHMIWIAKTDEGRKQINELLSYVNEMDYLYYGRPRADLNLIEKYLKKEDVIITTACIAGFKYDNMEEIIERLHNHFGDSMYLEYQCHINEEQSNLNLFLQEMSEKHNIKTIVGLDSHYIYPYQHLEREAYIKQKRKSSSYDDSGEDNWYMDYPSTNMIFSRFEAQGVLSENEVRVALKNTLDLLKCENIEFARERKMPIPKNYSHLSNKDRKKAYLDLIQLKFKEHMDKLKKEGVLTKELLEHYKNELKKETEVIIKGDVQDYFLGNYHIMRKGEEEYGGIITPTGRGCFTDTALVHTKTELKSIKDIQIGECVVSKDGNWNKVLNTMSYDIEEELIQISHLYDTRGKMPNICTKDHKIFIKRGDKIGWCKAENLKTSDYVCLPKIKTNGIKEKIIDLSKYTDMEYDEEYIYDVKYNTGIDDFKNSIKDVSKNTGVGRGGIERIVRGFNSTPKTINKILNYTGFCRIEDYIDFIKNSRIIKIKRFVNIDSNFLKLVGLMYGDGCLSNGKGCEISLAINSENHKNIENRKIFIDFFEGMGVEVTENKAKNGKKLIQLYARSKVLKSFLNDSMFKSKLGKEKQVNPIWLDCNKEEAKDILWGLFSSDGHASEDGRKAFDNSSKSIINLYKTLTNIARENPCSIQIRDAGVDSRGYNRAISYKIRQSKDPHNSFKSRDRILEDDKYWYLPIHEIIKLPKTKITVYDLTVENNPNYLLNNMIVHNSGVSWYSNFLLQFTKLDRVRHPLTMYPERFLTLERLKSGQMPDIDMNLSIQEPFIEAQKDIFGEGHSYWMLAYGTLREKASFKMYAGAMGLDPQLANDISKAISKYEEACKYGMIEDDEGNEILDPNIKIEDYIPSEYMDIYNDSKKYIGIVSDIKSSPCSFLLYTQDDIRREIGVMRLKGKDGKPDKLVACVEGYTADSYGFLKNDLLKVEVCNIIGQFYKRINQEIPDALNLYDMVKDDEEVWKIYENGYTMGINQFEKRPTAEKMMIYKPRNPVEIFLAVAGIRPAFKSLMDKFLHRKEHNYGIPSFDNLIQTPESPYTYLLFQELLMKAMVFAGIATVDTVDVVKAISKKKMDKIMKHKEMFLKGFAEKVLADFDGDKEKADKVAHDIWGVIEDAGQYCFNAPHSASVGTDSLYGAWAKAHYPIYFYETMLRIFSEKKDKEKCSLIKQEMWEYKQIELTPVEWGYDNTNIHAMEEENKITDSMLTYSYMSQDMAEKMYQLYLDMGNDCTFIDILMRLYSLEEKPPQLSTKIKILIKLQYFVRFGADLKLLKIFDIFFKYHNVNSILRESEDKIDKIAYRYCDNIYTKGGSPSEVEEYNNKPRTKKPKEVSYAKRGSGFRFKDFMEHIATRIPNKEQSQYKKIIWDLSYKKYTLKEIPAGLALFYVTKLTKSGKYVNCENLSTGKSELMKLPKMNDGTIEEQYIRIFDGEAIFEKWYKGKLFNIYDYEIVELEGSRRKKQEVEE